MVSNTSFQIFFRVYYDAYLVLAIREKILGTERPEVAYVLNNLAGLYKNQGAHEKALFLYGRALAIQEKILDAKHPSIASSLNNLAMLYQDQNAHEKALPLFERALKIVKETLGEEHPNTQIVFENYSSCLKEMKTPKFIRIIKNVYLKLTQTRYNK